MKEKTNKKNAGIRNLLIALVVLIIVAGILYGMKWYQSQQTSNPTNENIQQGKVDGNQVQEVEIKEIKTFHGDTRPIAVMIDNHNDARPQTGLNNAYIVYEIIVEGGYTRMMALFKDVDLEKIGPIRSSRHYFLDYALENDAIYVHYGWSPQAQSDIKKLKVKNINGIYQSSKDFWRTSGKYAPHDVLTSTKSILKIAESKDYKTVSNKESVLNYVADEINLTDGEEATKIQIPYSTSQKVSFKYNEKTKKYEKSANGKAQKDWITKEPIAAKNIIITFAANSTLNDGSGKGRQTLKNIGTLDGYYITNGKAIKIKCEKDSREDQTVYKDLEGKEIEINDGNTFIQICPLKAKVIIEGNEEA